MRLINIAIDIIKSNGLVSIPIILRLSYEKLYRILFYNNNIRIDSRTHIINVKKIKFMGRFKCGPYNRIEVIRNFKNIEFSPSLIFGNNVTIQDCCHIGCANKIIIGDNVHIASKVLITDHNHGRYSGVNQSSPLLDTQERELVLSTITIGKNIQISDGAVILPGVKIGDGCFIGSNTVVNRDIPSYSIAVGNPARIIKKYNFVSECWEKI